MAEETPSGDAEQGPTRHVLVVDDEEDICTSIETYLEGAIRGMRVRCEASGLDALSYLEAYPVDLIITDYRMPGMDGIEFLERSQEIRPDTPRIMLTAYPDLDLAMEAINEQEVQAFLTKPLEPLELVRTVRETLRKERRAANTS